MFKALIRLVSIIGGESWMQKTSVEFLSKIDTITLKDKMKYNIVKELLNYNQY